MQDHDIDNIKNHFWSISPNKEYYYPYLGKTFYNCKHIKYNYCVSYDKIEDLYLLDGLKVPISSINFIISHDFMFNYYKIFPQIPYRLENHLYISEKIINNLWIKKYICVELILKEYLLSYELRQLIYDELRKTLINSYL